MICKVKQKFSILHLLFQKINKYLALLQIFSNFTRQLYIIKWLNIISQ